jgi:multidrug efflux pump subunit AcrA (membrane-fusion protein)
MSSRRLSQAIGGLCVVLLCTLSACKGKESSGQGQRSRRPLGPLPVSAVTVTERSVSDDVRVVAPLVGREQSSVYSRVSGRVVAITKAEGDAVSAGTLLFRIERTEPGESFLLVPVTSPLTGWLGRLLAATGQQISPQDPLAVVVDDRALRATLSLPQDLHARLTMNTVVTVEAPGSQKPARIVSIARSGDADAGRGTLTIEVDNKDTALKAGTVVTATLRLDERPRLVVPTAALRITESGSYVFVVDAGRAKRTEVKFSLLSSNDAWISEGLSSGQVIAWKGNNLLTDGSEVTVIEKDGDAVKDSKP